MTVRRIPSYKFSKERRTILPLPGERAKVRADVILAFHVDNFGEGRRYDFTKFLEKENERRGVNSESRHVYEDIGKVIFDGPGVNMKDDFANSLIKCMTGFFVAALTVCFGPLMPNFHSGEYGSSYINIVCDTLYGIGFAITGWIFDYGALSSPLWFIGFLVWPLFVFGLVACCTYALLEMRLSFRVKAFFFLLLVVSFAFNVTVEWRFEHLNWLPSFQRDYFVSY
jgi:hypothetical protein